MTQQSTRTQLIPIIIFLYASLRGEKFQILSFWLNSDRLLGLAERLEEEANRDGVTKQIAAAIVVMRGGIFLVRRLSSESLLPGFWEFPSGGREPCDATILDVLQRELLEETGLTVAGVFKYLGFFDYATKSNPKFDSGTFWLTLIKVRCV